MPQHVWSTISGDPAKFSNDNNPVGTGPYKLTSFTPDLITYRCEPWLLGNKAASQEDTGTLDQR